MSDNTLLKLRNLKTYFYPVKNGVSHRDISNGVYTQAGIVKAVDDVSFDIEKGKNLGLVGESGCGKTVCCLSILKLLPEEADIVSGQAEFEGEDLLKMKEEKLRKIRGNEISFVFQEPLTSLNPVLTIGDQIQEAIVTHKNVSYKQAKEEAIDLLAKVKIDNPASRFNEYPHNLSGGMRQRVMIAMAISCEPKILIADEPTTALDVTIQAQILELLDELQQKMHMSVLIVSHDFGVVARLADKIAVMYAGQLVEYASSKEIFENPLHPYTKGLLSSINQIQKRKKRLTTLKGAVKKFYKDKQCRFYSRCNERNTQCKQEIPLKEVKPSHFVRCIRQ
jgi:oligopeptide/dipeptide ABC transporter ATP-binding protein